MRMTVRAWPGVLLTLLTALCVGAPALGQPLQGELDILLGRANLRTSDVGVMVYDPASRTVLAERGPERRFIPASNMKLITSGAALSVLGPEYRFQTRLVRDGRTLVVVGRGDPGFGDPKTLNEMELDVEELFSAWVEAVRESSPPDEAVVIDELIIDDRWFDREVVHPSWPTDQLNRWYCAEVSGLNFYTNTLAVYASPTNRGGSPRIEVEPYAPWHVIRNRARTSRTGSNTVWVSRPNDDNQMTLYGDVRWTTREPVWVAVHDMPMMFGRLLADRLAEAGMGRPKVRRAGAEEALPEGRTIALVETPMAKVMERCNRDSYNLYAESLLKTLAREVTGQPGSWSAGCAVLRMAMEERLGPGHASQLTASDGSGMSRDNRISPSLMTAWLTDLYEDAEIRDALLASMARPGEPGTLRKRFRKHRPDHEVYAKTGYLNGVSTLSGYVLDARTGRVVVYSVLVNDIPAKVPTARVKEMQEEVVLLAESWLEPATPRAAAPEHGSGESR